MKMLFFIGKTTLVVRCENPSIFAITGATLIIEDHVVLFKDRMGLYNASVLDQNELDDLIVRTRCKEFPHIYTVNDACSARVIMTQYFI